MRKVVLFFLVLNCIFVWTQEDIIPYSDDSIAKVVITPRYSSVFPGETIHFKFQAFTHDEREVPAAFSWQFSGGKLHHDGRFIAGDRPGTYQLIAESPNGIKAIAKIVIEETYTTDQTPVSIKITPEKIHLRSGEKCKFDFGVYNKDGKKVAVPYKIAYGGGELDSKGNFIAGNAPGKYLLKVSTDSGLETTADIYVGDIPSSTLPPVHLRVWPRITTLSPGEKCKFEITAYDKFGEKVDCGFNVSFSGGVMDADGSFVAGQVGGDYKFVATTSNNISATAEIHIIGNAPVSSEHNVEVKEQNRPFAKKITELKIIPSSVSLYPGESKKFEVYALNVYGEKIIPEINIQFSGGKFSPDGLYIAGDRPGQYSIVATSNDGHKATAKVHVLGEQKSTTPSQPGKLSKIIVTPERVRLHPHETVQFSFKAVDNNGLKVPASLSWSYGGGRLNSDGIYTAGYGYGQHYVTLEGENGISATSIVAIIPKTDEYIPHIWIEVLPRKVELLRGQSCKFDFRITNDYGQIVNSSKLSWEFMGGIWNSQTKTFTAGYETGDFYLRVKYNDSEYITARAHILVK